MFSFRLTDDFLEPYKTRPVNFGFADAAGNSLGEITFLRTYSRVKSDGTKERWWEVCERVINGMFSIQKDYAKANRLPWNDRKAHASAQEAYERLFTFKWTPPGRGLWMMGTELVHVHKNSAALQNCAFIDMADMDRHDPAEPFCWLMEASMLGIGVGFGTTRVPDWLTVREHRPGQTVASVNYVIPDSREGWVESLRLVLNHWFKGDPYPLFDYSLIRPEGEPIKTFGGTAAGPEPLRRLHTSLHTLLAQSTGRATSLLLGDIANLIGVCVVAGNVRRSAELWMGSLTDKEFLAAKDYSQNPYRADWGWMSNNSVAVNVGDDLTPIIDGIALNGEPGVIWMDVTRTRGRLSDPPNDKDRRAAGFNPCAEQPLESGELCTLVETYINNHDSLEDYQRTLKFAYLYGKTVTLLPTHWPKSNAIMQRNRRIGCSMSGIADFADTRGLPTLKEWMKAGYDTVQHYDRTYSEWLCVRESVRTTTVKPSGTVSILAGSSPGVHWGPGGQYFNRGIVFAKDDPIVALLRDAGYAIHPSAYSPDTSVFVQFPIRSASRRSQKEVSIFEKADLAALAQRYWSDNSVSVTVSFDPETEAKYVGTVLHMYDGQLKTLSFLPDGNKVYEQMPYQSIESDDWEMARVQLFPIDLSPLYNGGEEATGEKFCTTDACLIEEKK